jgi:hypothetical protein
MSKRKKQNVKKNQAAFVQDVDPVRRRLLIGIGAAGVFTAFGGGTKFIIDNYFSEPIVPSIELKNAKASGDVEVIQAYLDDILVSGKVQFNNTEVFYDPNFEIARNFYKAQAKKHPEREQQWEKIIKELEQEILEIERFREQYTPGNPYKGTVAAMHTHTGSDSEKVVTVYLLSPNSVTDDDILWELEHERCHAEVPNEYTLNLPPDFAVEPKLNEARELLSDSQIEEARCYTHQFSSDKFTVSKRQYNAALGGFRHIYSGLPERALNTEFEGVIIRELLKQFTNPYTLKFR